MLVAMEKVHIVGCRERLDAVLEELYKLRLVQIADVEVDPRLGTEPPPDAEARTRRREELRVLAAELGALLELAREGEAAEGAAGEPGAAAAEGAAADPAALRGQIASLSAQVEALTARIDALGSEGVVLGRYLAVLGHLLDAIPDLRLLDASRSGLQLATTVLVLGGDDVRVVDLLREALRQTVGERFVLLSAPVEDATGCVLVYPRSAADRVHTLLEGRRVREVPLPDAYRDLPLTASVRAMRRRLEELPAERAAAEAELEAVLRPHVAAWRAAHARLVARLEQLDAHERAGVTPRAFVIAAWLPRRDVRRLTAAITTRFGSSVLVEEVARSERDRRAPVLLRNVRPARTFESLVRFYDTPRARSFDPTALLALFVPLMFGLMVGDIAYGALLFAAATVLGRRAHDKPLVRDGARLLAIGAAWAMVFGVVFGEFLGDLGTRAFGLPALWVHRDDAEALEPLLVLAIAIGATHVVLGYVMALWQAWRDRSSHNAMAAGGSLLVLCGLFTLAAAAAERLPVSALGPAAGGILIGFVVLAAAGGAMGLVLAPIEIFGLISNVLSYLRLAAVGLASVYLAVIANELAGVGPVWLGIMVATLLHAINLALAGFTPAIQSLRLQYVEFFGEFFIGGGRWFRPFGTG